MRYGRPWIFALLAAAGLLLFLLVASQINGDAASRAEKVVFDAINGLPGVLAYIGWPFMQAGNLLVVPAGAVVAAALRRFRLAAAFVLVGVAKIGVARLIKDQVTRHRPGVFLDDVNVRLGGSETGLGFVSGHATIAVAVGVIIHPYLHSRTRVALWVVVALVLVGRVYVGAHLPLDVIGGGATGLAIGSLANLLVGVPHRDDAFRGGTGDPV